MLAVGVLVSDLSINFWYSGTDQVGQALCQREIRCYSRQTGCLWLGHSLVLSQAAFMLSHCVHHREILLFLRRAEAEELNKFCDKVQGYSQCDVTRKSAATRNDDAAIERVEGRGFSWRFSQGATVHTTFLSTSISTSPRFLQFLFLSSIIFRTASVS